MVEITHEKKTTLLVLWVTDDHSPDQWFDDVVEPGGVVAFFESEMNFTA